MSSSTEATLTTLYNRATRAFLKKDIVQTQSLLEAAVSILQTPASYQDPLASQRKKWDMLRITVETTIHSSPPSQSSNSLPDALRQVLLQTPRALIHAIYTRSLSFFSPPASPVCLPHQVLGTLVWSSLKLECPDVARSMIEEWLSTRQNPIFVDVSGEGYAKIIGLYCLEVLPRLDQLEYALEFLNYETELSSESRENFKAELEELRKEILTVNLPAQPSPVSPSPRSYSPTPSSSSSSSSLSTTSTHTVVPATPRPNRPGLSMFSSLPQASLSSVSISSNGTVIPNGHPTSRSRSRDSKSRSPLSSSPSSSSHPHLTSRPHTITRPSTRPPSAYALVKAALAPYLTSNNITAFFIIFVIVPLFSLIIGIRKRRRIGTTSNTAELVRQRLGETENWSIWREAYRIICDTIKMAGSGLV